MSDTLVDGKIEKAAIYLSEYSSLSFDINRVPVPAPVPPPIECVN